MKTTPTLVAAQFAIDDGTHYPGFHDPAVDWNGWAVPYFTREVAERIAALPWNVETLRFDAASDSFIETDGEGDECIAGAGFDTPHGRLYPVGSGWIWDAYPIDADAADREVGR